MDYLPDTQPAATFFRDSLVTIFYTYPEPTPTRPPPEARTEFERAAALTRNTRERAISSSPAPHPARLTQLTLGKNNKRLIPQRCRPISRRRKLQLPHWRKQLRHRPRCKQLPANTSISDMENLALP